MSSLANPFFWPRRGVPILFPQDPITMMDLNTSTGGSVCLCAVPNASVLLDRHPLRSRAGTGCLGLLHIPSANHPPPARWHVRLSPRTSARTPHAPSVAARRLPHAPPAPPLARPPRGRLPPARRSPAHPTLLPPPSAPAPPASPLHTRAVDFDLK